jgi:hypothetical protein
MPWNLGRWADILQTGTITTLAVPYVLHFFAEAKMMNVNDSGKVHVHCLGGTSPATNSRTNTCNLRSVV